MRIRTTCSPSIPPGWCPTSTPRDPPRRGPPPPCTGKLPTGSPRLDRQARASQLELTAHRLGHRSLAAQIAEAAPDGAWQTSWSHGRLVATGHQVLTGHTGTVRAVAVGALPDGTPVIVSGGSDRTVRVWRLADGTPVGEPLTGHDGTVEAVAVGALPDGTPVIVSGGDDGTVRVWRLADGTPVGKPLTGHAAR